MNFNSLRITIGRTFAFRTDDAGMVTTLVDDTDYRAHLGAANDGTPWATCTTPWTQDRSLFYSHMFGTHNYRDESPAGLHRRMTPFRRVEQLPAQPGPTTSAPRIETILHPFACTLLLHLDMFQDTLPDDTVQDRIDAFLHDEVLAGKQRRGLADHHKVPPIANVDEAGRPIVVREVDSGFTLVSAIPSPATPSEAIDAPTAAALLAAPVKLAADDKRWPLLIAGSALAHQGDRIGLVIGESAQASRSLKCLHTNSATLLALIQNLAVVALAPPDSIAVAAEVMADRARLIIDHLVKRTPIQGVSVYRSRLAEVWAGHRALA